jgi:hypothetical protein
LDTDVELLKDFDTLLDHEAFAGFEIPYGSAPYQVNFGQGFGAAAGCQALREMMDIYEDLQFIKPDGTLNLIASPEYQTACLQKIGLRLENVKQNLNGFAIYPTEYFCPLNAYTGEMNITGNTYSIHHFNASWMPAADRERRELRKKYHKFLGGLGSEIASTLVSYHRHYGLAASREILRKLQSRAK